MGRMDTALSLYDIAGLAIGLGALGLGILNFVRDLRRGRPRLRVRFCVHVDAGNVHWPAVEVENDGLVPVFVDGFGVCAEKRGAFRKKPGKDLGGDPVCVDGLHHAGKGLEPKAAFVAALASAGHDDAWLRARAYAVAEGRAFFSGRLRDELPDFASAWESGK